MSGDRFCPQCYRDKPSKLFRSKDRKRFVRCCRDCRKRYSGWEKLSPRERLARMRKKPRTGNGYFVALVISSGNRKTGRMPVSMTDQKSCPTSCTFQNAGCYAEFGKTRSHWQTVPKRGKPFVHFLADVRALPPDQIWRHNEAGDLPGKGDYLDIPMLEALVAANAGRRGFTFTHKPVLPGIGQAGLKSTRDAIYLANREGFTINLSANSLAHADELADLGIGPVAVVLDESAPDRLTTPAGRDVVVCLNETRGLTCLECQLCAVASRKSIVGFRAHGQAKAIVSGLVTLRLKKAS